MMLMPNAAPRPCTEPGCNALAEQGSRCKAHPYKKQRTTRGKANKRLYNTARWRNGRAIYIKAHPLCVMCKDNGRVTEARVVDHIIPHKGDIDLFYNQSNWQSLCFACHNSKTAREDGGFGR